MIVSGVARPNIQYLGWIVSTSAAKTNHPPTDIRILLNSLSHFMHGSGAQGSWEWLQVVQFHGWVSRIAQLCRFVEFSVFFLSVEKHQPSFSPSAIVFVSQISRSWLPWSRSSPEWGIHIKPLGKKTSPGLVSVVWGNHFIMKINEYLRWIWINGI